MRRLTALALLPGCMFIVTKDRTSEVGRAEVWHDPMRIGQPVPLLSSQVRGSGVDVFVIWQQLCDTTGDLVIQTRTHTGATLKVYDPCGGSGSSGCGVLIVFAIVAAPFTLSISGVATAIAVGAADDRMDSKSQPLPTRRGPCNVPAAGVHVIVAPPGRDAVQLTTDASGRAYAEVGDAVLASQSMVQLAP